MRSRARIRPVLIALASASALALALAGCSNGSSDGADPAARDTSGTTLAEVQKAGSITVATEGTYRPFSYHAGGSGRLTGYDIEVTRAVAKKLGVTARFEETQFDGIFAGLDAGRFDLIANQISINPERQEKYDLSAPYTVSAGVLVVKDGSSIRSFADLSGKSSAQSLTSNWYQVAQDAGAQVQQVEGWAQAAKLVQQGRVDATVNDELTYLDAKKTGDADGLVVAATSDDESQSAFAARKGSETLIQAIDTALDELRADGTLARISEKYFGQDVSQ